MPHHGSVFKLHVFEGLRGVCDLVSRLWRIVAATPFSRRSSCRSVFLRFFHSFKFCPQPVDLFHLQGEVQGRSLVTFSTKLQMVEALRDPVVQRKYPNLAISKKTIVEKWADSLRGTIDAWKWTGAYVNFWYLVNLLWWAVAKALLCLWAHFCLFCDNGGFRYLCI